MRPRLTTGGRPGSCARRGAWPARVWDGPPLSQGIRLHGWGWGEAGLPQSTSQAAKRGPGSSSLAPLHQAAQPSSARAWGLPSHTGSLQVTECRAVSPGAVLEASWGQGRSGAGGLVALHRAQDRPPAQAGPESGLLLGG